MRGSSLNYVFRSKVRSKPIEYFWSCVMPSKLTEKSIIPSWQYFVENSTIDYTASLNLFISPANLSGRYLF
jgi:hypothetical protein